jgi:23S rRNA pseudouridine1911/1915/1917 synthase
MTESSWNATRTLIHRGKVTINDQIVTDAGTRVRPGATVTVTPSAPRLDRVDHALSDDSVVFVDQHLVVVNKPSGISTVPYDDGERGTLVDRVRIWLHRTKGAGLNAPVFVVHRIDKETSGLVVFARTWLAKRWLAGLFRSHEIDREYWALVHGTVPWREQVFDTVLLEDRGDGIRGSAKNPTGNAGKRAITTVTFLSTHGNTSLVRCRLQTGRTHQIRIHLAEAGHPIVGERVYGPKRYGRNAPPDPYGDESDGPGAERMMLHARLLGFSYPDQADNVLKFSVEPPEDFTALLAGT